MIPADTAIFQRLGAVLNVRSLDSDLSVATIHIEEVISSEMANASDDTVLIIPFRLPAALESLRRRSVPDAMAGLSAHATLLGPFAPPETLDDGIREKIQAVLSEHSAFSCRLIGRGQWPGVVFASIEAEAPFRSLYADLLAAFPEFPSNRGKFEFVPHVTIAQGSSASESMDDPAWRCLPTTCEANLAHLIVRGPAGWDVKWAFDLRPNGD